MQAWQNWDKRPSDRTTCLHFMSAIQEIAKDYDVDGLTVFREAMTKFRREGFSRQESLDLACESFRKIS